MRIFKEEQRFGQLWIIVILVTSSIVPMILFIKAYNNNKMSLLDLIIASSLVIFSCLLIFVFKLTTKIDEEGIHYKFFPIHFSFKLIKWSDISEIYTRKYDAISEYGGWGCKGGILWKKSNGVAYNVSGEEGLQIITKEGKKILIGTKQIHLVDQCVHHYFNKNKETNV